MTYKVWRAEKLKVVVKQIDKECPTIVKKDIQRTKGELDTNLKGELPKCMLHLRNIRHQYAVINNVKKTLPSFAVLVPHHNIKIIKKKFR